MEVLMTRATDPGRVRSGNEDAASCVADPKGQRGYLMVVADGMGGAEAGEVASRMAVDVVREEYFNSGAPPAEALARAVSEANARIHRCAEERPEARGMGTTCTALAVVGGLAYVAHVGDSRAYLVRRGYARRLTRVHSVWAERVSGDGASPAITDGRNVLTRALGVEPEVAVDVGEAIGVEAGDRFLLCSDGLWGLVTDPEIAALVQAQEPAAACRQLVVLANDRGGPDNITVVVAEAQV